MLSGCVVVDTETALNKWEEAPELDGAFHLSRSNNSIDWRDTLYKSKRGIYYITTRASFSSRTTAKCVSLKEAAAWLVLNDHPLPEDLKEFEDGVIG